MDNPNGLLAVAGLMVVCCLLPVIVLGGGAAGIFAWIGGLNPFLILAAVAGGGVLAYHILRRARVAGDRRETLPGSSPTAAPSWQEPARRSRN